MNTLKACGLLGLLLLLTAPSQVRADDVRKEIQAAYGTLTRAYNKSDTKTYAGMFTPDFKIYYKGGKWDSRENVVGWLENPPKNTRITLSVTIKALTAKRDQAVATVTETMRYVYTALGAAPTTNSSFETIRATWIKTPKGWRLQKNEPIDEKRWVEGK